MDTRRSPTAAAARIVAGRRHRRLAGVADGLRLRRRDDARRRRVICSRSTRRRARMRVADASSTTTPGGGLDSSPVPFNGMLFQAFKGDESSDHSNPGFAILDGSRDGRRRDPRDGRTIIPADDFAAGYRGGSIVGTPSVDLERKLIFAGTGNPASQQQHPRTNSLLKIDADPGVGRRSAQILDVASAGTSDSYPAPHGRRVADLPARGAVADRALLVRAVRLQLPLLAEPVEALRRAPDVRRAAEVGRLHGGLHRHDGASPGRRPSGAPCFGLQPELDGRRRRTGSTSR